MSSLSLSFDIPGVTDNPLDKDAFADFDELMSQACCQPPAVRDVVFALVEEYFVTGTHSFLAYYRDRADAIKAEIEAEVHS